MASDLIARFDGMVEELRRDPEIDVLHYLVRPPNPSEIEEVERALGYSLGAAIKEFYAALTGDAPVRVTAEDGLAALQIALAAAESARSGRPVALTPLPEVQP